MKFKKIRKIYRILFPKKFTDKELFEVKLANNEQIASFDKKDDFYEIKLINDIKVIARNEFYSDYFVFEQIFNFKEYASVLSILKLNNFGSNYKIIIDAGANVGYTSVFFAHNLEKAKIFAIEPSEENANICTTNFSYVKNKENIKLYQSALSQKEGMFYNIDRDFRDGKDWSIVTKIDQNGSVKGITINEIIKENRLEYISLLKIDIEGAERFIINSDNDLSYLKITQVIAIEIHDEFDIRESICEILKQNKFVIFESGELTIGINVDLNS